MLVGYISSTSYFQGRRVTLIVSCLFFTLVWNLIWLTFSDIPLDHEQSIGNKVITDPFDIIMFLGQLYLSWVNHYLILYSGPVDICKTFMLRENKKILALMLGMMGGIKMLVCGSITDDLFYGILNHTDFHNRRMITILFDALSIFMLVAIVRDEIGEVFLQKKQEETNQDLKASVLEINQKKESHKRLQETKQVYESFRES